MTSRRPWVLGAVRRPIVPLILSLVSAGATAGFAGYFLRQAWTGFTNCHSSGGPGCPAHPFWGLSPELYLAACLLGVGAGALIAVVGGLAFLGRMDRRRAGYALVAFGAIGVIAYGGLGIGAAAGVAAGALVLRGRNSRAGAPSEWSGSLPTGVPPVLRGPKRPLTDRPSVTEWDGIFAATPAGPPGKGRGRVFLPPADRLAAALEKGRTANLLQAGPASSLPPATVIVLPPPPTGLRIARPPPLPAAPAARPVQGPFLATPARAGPGPERVPATETAQLRSTWAQPVDRWQPTTKEVSPWVITVDAGSVGQGRPVQPAAAPAAPPPELPPSGLVAPPLPLPREPVAGRSAPPLVMPPPPAPMPALEARHRFRPPLRAPQLRSTPPPSRPVPEAPPALTVPTSLTPPPPLSVSSGPAAPPPVSAPPPFPAPVSAGPPPAPPSPYAGPPDTLPTPAPESSVSLVPPETAPTAASRPAPPAQPIAKTRTRAWRCPKCNLINAPWSVHCTKCKTEPPAIGS